MVSNLLKGKIIWFLIPAFIVLIHVSYLKNGFTWLEHNDIEETRAIVNLRDISKAFVQPFGETTFYRPFVVIAHSLDYKIWGSNPFGFRLSSLLIHLANVFMFVLFFKTFWKPTRSELVIGSLIFGLHPYSIFIVASAIQKQESMLVFFTFSAVYFYTGARSQKKIFHRLIAPLLTLCALFSKETAIAIIPILITLWEFITRLRIKKSDVILIFSEISVFLIYFYLRFKAVPLVWTNNLLNENISIWIGTRVLLLNKFLGGLVSPFAPSLNDSYLVTGITHPAVAITILILLMVIWKVYKAGIDSEVGRAVILIAIFLMPAMNIITVPRVASPHYGYLMIAPFAVFFALVAENFKDKIKSVFLIVLTLWLATASVVTYYTGFKYKSDLTLFNYELSINSNYPEANFYLGNYYLEKNDLEKTQKYYLSVMSQNPGYNAYIDKRALLVNSAVLEAKKGNRTVALELLENAKKGSMGKTRDQIIYNEALIYFSENNYKKAIELLENNAARMDNPNAILLLKEAQNRDK